MSNRVIPAESLTHYQRWQPQPLADVPLASDPVPQAPEAEAPVSVEAADEVIQAEALPDDGPLELPSAEELARIHEQAQQDGYAAGLAEGQALVDQRVNALSRILDDLSATSRVIEDQLADHVVTLAVRLAEQVLRTELEQRPESLAALVREVTAATPYLGDQPKLFLHPDDLALLQPILNAELTPDHWLMLPDPTLTRGGCRLDTAGGSVDATLETRWQRVLAALGRHPASP